MPAPVTETHTFLRNNEAPPPPVLHDPPGRGMAVAVSHNYVDGACVASSLRVLQGGLQALREEQLRWEEEEEEEKEEATARAVSGAVFAGDLGRLPQSSKRPRSVAEEKEELLPLSAGGVSTKEEKEGEEEDEEEEEL